MKRIIFLLGCVLAGQLTIAQTKPTDLDKSPMDVSYYPANFPILKMRGQATGDPLARILYSRPQKKGRDIFGEEIKYGEVWRFGANEATEIELFKNATIAGKKVLKGRYALYCVPTETKWTIVLNKDNYSWGSFTYKSDKDAVRVDVPVQKNSPSVEALTMFFENKNLVILWDQAKAEVPFTF